MINRDSKMMIIGVVNTSIVYGIVGYIGFWEGLMASAGALIGAVIFDNYIDTDW